MYCISMFILWYERWPHRLWISSYLDWASVKSFSELFRLFKPFLIFAFTHFVITFPLLIIIENLCACESTTVMYTILSCYQYRRTCKKKKLCIWFFPYSPALCVALLLTVLCLIKLLSKYFASVFLQRALKTLTNRALLFSVGLVKRVWGSSFCQLIKDTESTVECTGERNHFD